MKSLEDFAKIYALPAAFMTVAGFADSLQTYYGVQRHGLEHLADTEANPLLQMLITSIGTEGGLFLPKAVVSTFVLGLSAALAKRDRNEGKYLLTGAGLWWSVGFFSNYFLYYS